MAITAFAILLGFLPAAVWLLFFLREDIHPEPKKWLAITFFTGALASTPVFFLEFGLQEAFKGVGSAGVALFLIVVFALIEEVFKFGSVFLLLRRNPILDEPVDALIYLVVAALGFATVENVFVAGGIAGPHASVAGFLASGTPLYTLSLRLAGATLLHALSSALAGYYWARGRIVGKTWRFVVWGIVAATALHALFNYFVSVFEDINLVYPTLFLLAAGFFVLGDFEKIKKIS